MMDAPKSDTWKELCTYAVNRELERGERVMKIETTKDHDPDRVSHCRGVMDVIYREYMNPKKTDRR